MVAKTKNDIYPKLTDLIDRSTIKDIQNSLGQTFETGVVIIDPKDSSHSHPGQVNKFCRLIKSTQEGAKRCDEFLAKVKGVNKPTSLTCPAGLSCLITPITTDEVLIGLIVVEGLLTSRTKVSAKIKKISSELGIEVSKLTSVLKEIDIISKKNIVARETHLFSIVSLISNLCYQKHQLDKKNIEISGLFEINKTIISTMDLRKVLMSIVKAAASSMGLKKCSIRLLDEKGKILVMTTSIGLSKEYLKKTEIRVGKSIVGKVVKQKKPMFVSNIDEDNRLEDSIRAKKENIASLLSVPLIFQNRVLGAITIYSTRPHKYSEDEIALLCNLADQATIAIENIRLFVLRREGIISITQSLAETIEAKDSYTRGHCEKVAHYAVIIADRLGLSTTKQRQIYLAGLFHDIGKIGVSENILLKPGALTLEEFNDMKKHPSISVKILSPIDFPGEILSTVYQHHERIDGKGYPYGIVGKDITLDARIIEIADSYDAMTSDRPYRKALSKSNAIIELKRCAGMQFDPEIVDIFIKILEEEDGQSDNR
ncbi:MAG: PocR ligand-binding domain-containing protein [bacterium]|nr:PocR ligand-binding domain-containing protein [bacterium]